MSKAAYLLLCIGISFSQTAIARTAGRQAQPKQEKPDQTIRLKSELVQVRAVVTDKQGRPVSNLKKEDFELLEDNRPQDISFFSVENISNQPGPNKPGEQSPLRARPEDPARTVVLFVDMVHISFENLARTRQALKQFVDQQMTDRDVVALMTSSGSLGLMEQFTRDRDLLRAAIDRLTLWRIPMQETLFSPYLAARIFNGDSQAEAVGTEILSAEDKIAAPAPYVRSRARQVLSEAAYRRKVTLSKLKAVVEHVAGMPGQRMISLFSEGFTLADSGGINETSDLQAIISRAVRSGVVIYSISAQGLNPVMVPASLPGIIEGRRGSRLPRPSLTTYMASADRDLENGLNALARDTGGEAFFNTNDMSGRLQKALNDNRIYYAIAYQTPNADAGDKNNHFRRITLRVKNHPDYKVRAQRGYQPLAVNAEERAATPRQRLVQAMTGPLPVTTIPVAASADYFEREGTDGQVSLQVYIDASAIKYREQDQNYLFDLDLATAIYDLAGNRVHLATNEAHGNFTPQRFEAAKRNGYRYAERVSIKPGIYQVRVGVLEPATERIGTATAWVEVPDLSKGKLTLSAVLLSKDSEAQAQTASPSAGDQSASPAVTQGIRVYKRGEVLNYNLMVYPASNKGEAGDGLLMQTEIAKGDQQIYLSQWQPVSARAIERNKKGVLVAGNLKLNNVKPGIYELRIAVKDSKSKKPAERAILFGVEP